MAGIGGVFEIARSGLRAHQQGLATTAHNISNLQTKGYSRQDVVLATGTPRGSLESGGVKVEQIRRNVDTFLENQFTALQEDVGQLTGRHHYLVQADSVVSEGESSGVGFTLTEFFNAVRDVATNPEGTVQRNVLLGKAATLTDEVNRVSQSLDRIRRDADGEISTHVASVNRLAKEIGSLNQSIFRTEARNDGGAHDLRDQRQLRINELAELVNIDTVDMRDGVAVMVGGQLLVGGGTVNSLTTVSDADNVPHHDVAIENSAGQRLVITTKLDEGKIGGLLTLRDQDIVGFEDRLDRTAAVLTNEFNQQHAAGFGLDGSTGNAFFSALAPGIPLGDDLNTGGAEGTSVAVSDPTALTFDNYEITFSSSTTFDVVNATTGVTVLGAQTYTSGASITFDGLTAVITNDTGAPAANDTFAVSAHKGAAANLAVSVTNTDQFAASSTAAGAPGNNVNALALVGIHTARHGELGNVTLNNYHTITAGNVGSTTKEVEQALTAKEAETAQVEAFRQQVSGVSLDEELTKLLEFQRAYEASARVITVADGMLETVLNMTR